MPIDLYSASQSPPCRAVLLVARALNLKLNVRRVNLLKGEQLTLAYIKMNPQHTIPTLNDDGMILSESRAIMAYLVDQYGKTDALNPKDPKKSALVNQRLYFDSSTLYPRLVEYCGPVLKNGEKPDKDKAAKFEEALGYLNSFLEGKTWVAGNQKTIADYSLVVTVSTAEAIGVRVNAARFANVSSWFARAKLEMAEYEELDGIAAKQLGQLFKSRAGTK